MPLARVAVVTDSTAYLPDGLTQSYGVTVVPLHVAIHGVAGTEGEDVTPAVVAAVLAERRGTVTTSRPSPAELAAAYQAAFAGGAAGVVSVHLSGSLSGTVDAARTAASEVDGQVLVVDSRSAAMGLGFTVLAAAEAAARGAGAAHVAAAAQRCAEATRTLLALDTVEHLRRGGRISAASALLGTALAVKPLLHVVDGRIMPLEKVRTSARALTRLADLAAQGVGDGRVDVAVHHLAAPHRAVALADALRARLPGLGTLYTSEVGAVVGAHVGPGAVAAVVVRRG